VDAQEYKMPSSNEAGDRVAILQMNAELRNAQLEMLSAQCATDRLRLRYSAEHIARHGQPDTLRKAWSAANTLHEYYNSITRLVPSPDDVEKSSASSLNEAKLEEAIARVADFLRAQRERFRPDGLALDRLQRQTMQPFFSAALLDQVRIVMLDRQRIPNPPFYVEAKAMGIKDLPNLTHMRSLTFEDVLVFQGEIAVRALFHALVHAVQFEVLGLERYTEMFVRGFLRTGTHVNVPLEAHVFLLESEFAGSTSRVFSVEERVRLWANQGRY
jgi:hypothetical protein